MTTRRKLVIGTAGALLGAAAGPAAALIPAAAGARPRAPDVAPGSDLIGAQFGVYAERGRISSARLARVEPGRADARVEQFTVTFTAPAFPALASGTYRLGRPGLGRFALYLEVSPGGGVRQTLRADFNLLRDAPHLSADLEPLLTALRGRS